MVAIHGEKVDGREELILVAVGPDHEVAHAARYLETLTPLFSKTEPPGALSTPLTWAAVIQLQVTFGESFVRHERLQAWINAEAARRGAAERAELVYEPPAPLRARPYQAIGAALISELGRVLITDEPGTGKTITTILGLVERAAHTGHHWQDGPVLVVCPASVIDSWVEAWTRWAPHVRAVAWRGPKRKQLAESPGQYDVYVTSYETARIDAPSAEKGRGKGKRPLLDLDPSYLVIDECHLIKNPSAARTKALHRLAKCASVPGGAVVALSGTPITHHPGDLWATLVALEPHAWPAKERWVKRYCETLAEGYDETVLGLHPATEPEFRLALLGQHRRVAKADVLTDLPPKVYSVRTVDMPKEWRKAYDDFEAQMLAELPGGDELMVMDVLTKVGMLYTLSSAAADVEITYGPDVDEKTGEPKRHIHLSLKAPSWKVEALLEILAERPGEPVVAFAQSRQLMMLAGAAAEAAGLRVGYVAGEQTAGARTKAVADFQAGLLDLICVTTGAGGVGITLTAARTCVFLQRPWSLVESIQAEDRCHRIGSEVHDSIEVIDIVAKNTVDSRVRSVLRERAGQLSDLVQDPRIASSLLGGCERPDVNDPHPTTNLKEAS